ncbi:MAG TPA: 5'-3' exonuclease H3TH domain-containing protein, partial [Polyangiaceae bacterium]|nr:5'-3' exonuclease H3TH domain-containing protein [Polyangiaceae bacterium]
MASAVLPPAASPGLLYLIDLSGYVFRAYHAIAPLSSSKGEPTHAVMGTVNMLQKVVNDRRPELLAVAMDSRGPTFRKAIDSRYKAHRPVAPPDLTMQMARCESIVKAYNIPIYQAEGVEADDLIACVISRARKDGMRVIVVSADKDLMQLVDDEKDDVLLWDSMRDKVYGPAEVREKFGVAPSKVRDLLALTGDTSDNIPGVPSVGPKTAADLLNEYGTIDGIYEKLGAIKKVKLREALTKHESDARISQRLVTLREDCDIAWDPVHLRYGGADTAALRELFLDLEFNRMLDQLQVTSTVERHYESVLDAASLGRVLEAARKKKRLGFELILSEPDPMRAAIVGVALSTEPGDGYYVPISHRYLGAPSLPTWDAVREALSPLFSDPAIEKTSHHLKVAHLVLLRYGVRLEGAVFDTMLAAYLLDPDSPESLRELARKALGIEFPVYGEKKPGTGAGKRKALVPFDNLPVDEATPFAAAEAE